METLINVQMQWHDCYTPVGSGRTHGPPQFSDYKRQTFSRIGESRLRKTENV